MSANSPETSAIDAQKKRYAPIALALACMLLTAVASLHILNRTLEHSHWVTHSAKTRGHILAVLTLLQDAETGQRGFLLTGNESYLEPYNYAVAQYAETFDRLTTSVSENPSHLSKAHEIDRLAHEKFTELQSTIDSARLGEEKEALELVQTDIGKQLMESMRSLTDQMLFDESELFVQHEEQLSTTYLWSATLLIMSSLAGISIVWIAMARQQKTTRAAAVQFYQAGQVKERFLATMSHEIRTPMNGIVGMAEVISQSDLDQQQQENVQGILSSAATLLTILNDTLDVSRLHAGQLMLYPSIFDLRALFKDCVSVFAHTSVNKQVTMQYEIDAQTATHWLGDEGRIRQIICNLLSNSAKFTHEGSITCSASATHDGLQICVRDTGIGMDDETIAHMFEPFTQADSTTNREYGGTGLGMTIVNELVNVMQGSVSVMSTLNQGTSITVCLPLKQTSTPQTTTSVSLNTAQTFDLKVLVVDDELMNVKVASAQLNKLGCQVDTARNGAEAVTKATQTDSDSQLILMDIMMPVLDGYGACCQIREWEQQQPHSRRVPIVALTANALPEDREKSLAHGMDEHLTKPLLRKKLIEQLRAVQGRA